MRAQPVKYTDILENRMVLKLAMPLGPSSHPKSVGGTGTLAAKASLA